MNNQSSKTDKYLEVVNSFTSNKTKHYLVRYRCGETIECVPPYVEGKIEYDWKSRKMPDVHDKKACENYIGMKLQAL